MEGGPDVGEEEKGKAWGRYGGGYGEGVITLPQALVFNVLVVKHTTVPPPPTHTHPHTHTGAC